MIRNASQSATEVDPSRTTRPAPDRLSRLAAVLGRHRREASDKPPRGSTDKGEKDGAGSPAPLCQALHELVDYLALYLRTRDRSYKYLLTNELIGRFAADPAGRPTLTLSEAEAEVRAFAASFSPASAPTA